MTTSEAAPQHTPEPWAQERASKSLHARTFQRVIVSPGCEYVIAELMQFGDDDPREANARRIVACVNACKGISNERLDEMAEEDRYFGRTVISEAEAREQDAIKADLLGCLQVMCCPIGDKLCRNSINARAAIARARGGQQ